MLTFPNVWLYRAGAYTNLSATAFTGAALTLTASDKLYFGADDWLSGILFFMTTPGSISDYVVEVYDGEAWKTILAQNIFENQQTASEWIRGWEFQSDGMLYWGKSQHRPELTRSSATFPEATTPPATETRFWYRIRIVTGGPKVNKVFPIMYNVYTTPSDVAEFLGVPEFDDTTSPSIDFIRKTIRDQEDFIDSYARKSWRMRYSMAETSNFNPYGIRPRHQPPLFVTRLGLWNGSGFEVLEYGRGENYYLDVHVGMIYLTLPSWRLRFSSWLLSRYIRQPGSLVYDYLWGTDFETDDQAEEVAGIAKRLVGADLVRNNDETGIFRGGLDVMSKSEKVQSWKEEAMERLESLRSVYMTGLGSGAW
jgi:hypothetical protein